jgi:hypothetical protein
MLKNGSNNRLCNGTVEGGPPSSHLDSTARPWLRAARRLSAATVGASLLLSTFGMAAAGAQEVPIRGHDVPDGPNCSPIDWLPEEFDAQLCWTKTRLHDSSYDYDEWLYHSELRVTVTHHGACGVLRCPQVRLNDIVIGHEPTAATKAWFIDDENALRWTPAADSTSCEVYSDGLSKIAEKLYLGGAFDVNDCATVHADQNYGTGHVLTHVVGADGCNIRSITCVSPGQKTLVAHATSIIRTKQRPNDEWRPYFHDYYRIQVRNSFPDGFATWGNKYLN